MAVRRSERAWGKVRVLGPQSTGPLCMWEKRLMKPLPRHTIHSHNGKGKW